ncbi:DUF2828 domain-containing protein [Caproiciproducens sp. MSJ-32]|uniref:DUF2828 domain-containing protein n=1 Tax=Caproiciproducens sp. MSJ-32 TaxID=2841527 RepID=UPI001C0FE5EB|nr:DUF2828 domain-containing protein [Caproiciproducens sp. MSJ-32]MBU5455873.1 DUF2828 domain-containing protein [Caproiciproducens sp. MSJ-32]
MDNLLIKFRNEMIKLSEIDLGEDVLSEDNPLYDFIDNINIIRKEEESRIIARFVKCINYKYKEALKLFIFIRDKINGLGERRIFKVLLRYLAETNPNFILKNLLLIPKYGRYDDLYALFNTSLQKNVIELFRDQISKDIIAEKPSNLGKWLKSENTSSEEARKLALETRLGLGYSSKEYRKLLSFLRERIGVLEKNLSLKRYDNINYKEISLRKIIRYKNLFLKEDLIYFKEYLYSDDFVLKDPLPIIIELYNNIGTSKEEKDLNIKLFNKYLKSIKSYTKDDTLVVNAITEESKIKKYIYVFIMMFLIYKNLNSSGFKNYYIYFEDYPKFKKINGEDLFKDIEAIKSTNNKKGKLFEALDLLLFTILRKNISLNDIPETILYITNSFENLNASEINKYFEKNWFNIRKKPKIKLLNLNSEKFKLYKEENVIFINGYKSKYLKNIIEEIEVDEVKEVREKFNNITYEIEYI